jgi:NADPH2 dehydrogenase
MSEQAIVVPKLFQPLRVGDITLQHRVILAPLTRFRANKEHVHQDIAAEYYEQRAEVPGTLLITEATFIAGEAGGYNNVPGIWSEDQIQAWKNVCIIPVV